MSNPDQISQRMNELSNFIERAQQQLSDGQVVDLTHLDDEVAKLCDLTLKDEGRRRPQSPTRHGRYDFQTRTARPSAQRFSKSI